MGEKSNWLSLSEAAQLLGVHFTTLRRWTDQGLIEYIRTPGGKRRYTHQAVEDFLNRRRHNPLQPAALLPAGNAVVLKMREQLLTSKIIEQTWYVQMSEEQRLQLRKSGNRLLALLFQYCAREANGEIFLKEGSLIAHEYGQFCYLSGMTLPECTRTFLFFRRSILNSIHEAGTLQTGADIDNHLIFQRMVYFFDELTVSMISEYTYPTIVPHS